MIKRCCRLRHLAAALSLSLVAVAAQGGEKTVDEYLAIIGRVGPQAQGSAEARRACDALSHRGVELLPRLLTAMDTRNIVAANWYRSVYQTIVERELTKPKPGFERDVLKSYVADPQHEGRSRRLVLQLLDRIEPEFGRELLPRLLDDPEFRADAVELALTAGDAAKARGAADEAKKDFRLAFEHAREGGQITTAAEKLADAGEKVDVPRHMGFVTSWWLAGPFDAPGISGFDKVFPPEAAVELKARYQVQDGTERGWQPWHKTTELGEVNLIDVWGATREAAAYAYAEVISPTEQTVELRASADDNCTVWLNGEKILARRQWGNGTRLDRFKTPATLHKGANKLLVKICQGPQHRDPEVSNNWTFQVRFCDAAGTGLALENALKPEQQ